MECRGYYPDTAHKRYFDYYLGMIIHKGKIIDARLLKEEALESGSEDIDSVVVREIASFRNDRAYADMRALFVHEYGAEMQEKELFSTETVYGDWCGFGGSPPPYKEQMDTLVAHNDRAGIVAWLQSASIEKQVYAFDACHDMKLKGIKLSPEEQRLCKLISKKKGLIQTCGGCLYGAEDIREVISGIKKKKEVGVIGSYRWEE